MKLESTLLGILLCTACVTTGPKYFTEESIREKELPSKGTALLGISLWFDGIPEELEWNVNIVLRESSSQKTFTALANGRDFVEGKTLDRAPVIYSVPEGKYQIDSIVLEFPKEENPLYSVAQERVVLKSPNHVPEMQLAEGWMMYAGEVKIGKSEFVVGKPSQAANISAIWNPTAPLMGTTWQGVREQVRIASAAGRSVSGASGTGMQPAFLMYEKTTDAAMTALKSGFSESFGTVLVRAAEPGFAFFEDAAGNLSRVKSAPIGESHYFVLASNASDRVSLRGFCFDASGDAERCLQEEGQEEPMFTRGELEPGIIRYRGSVARSGSQRTISPILTEKIALEMDKEVPGAQFSSFVLGGEPRKRENYGVTLFNEAGVRTKWDAASQVFAEKALKKAAECDSLLRGIDPFISSAWEAYWEPAAGGALVVKEDSVKGLGKNAMSIVKTCLESDPLLWKDIDKTEIGQGFGVRYR